MFILTTLVILFVIFYLIFLYFRGKRCIPTNWPVFGMMPGLLLNINRVHEYATEITEQSGGTFLFKGPWLTKLEMLITSDPSNVHYILTKNFSNFPKGPDFKKIFDILGDGIFAAESESWENQRKITLSLVHNTCFQEFVAKTSWNKTEIGLLPILELVSDKGMEVDIQEIFQRFAFDCSCILVLGHDPTSLCTDLPYLPHEKAFVDAEEAVLLRHILPESFWKLQKLFQIGKEKKLSNANDILDRFLSYCISLKRENCNVNEDFDMLTRYKRALLEKNEARNVSEVVWRDTMLNLIFAGKDTISATLTWFFWLLATNPAQEEKIRQEISTNLNVKKLGKWKYSNLDELKKLVYLHGALCESLRLFPPVAFQHKAPLEHDILPSGHSINSNTKTVISFYSMGRMESIWGKDCLEFKPERWISEMGHIKNEPSFKFTAFNAGPRSCLGKEMSFIQMKIVAAAIISRFKIRVVEGHPVSPSTSVILHMKHGLKVNVSNYV